MDGVLVAVICVLALLTLLPLIFFLFWVILRKTGHCQRTHYSHDITTESHSGEILAVVSTINRAQAVTNGNINATAKISRPSDLQPQEHQHQSEAGPFWGRQWERQWAYASYPHPSYHTHNQRRLQQRLQEFRQNYQHKHFPVRIPSVSGGMELIGAGNGNQMTSGERLFGLGGGPIRPLPPYSELGGLGPPPSYPDALALQKLRNSVR